MPGPINKYYPSLKSIISSEDIPDSFGTFKEGIEALLDKIHYKDLRYSKSPKGDSAYYSLYLVRRRLELGLFGSGIKLIFNPDDDDQEISVLPISLEYQWKVLSYLRDFNIEQLGLLPKEIFELIVNVLQISEQESLAHFISIFVEPEDGRTHLQQFVNDINDRTGFAIAIPEIETLIEDVIKGFHEKINENTPNLSTYGSTVLFGIYILKGNLEETKDNLKKYFKAFLPDDLEAYLLQIIIPKAATSIGLSAAIEFPREILKPVDPNSLEVVDGIVELSIGKVIFKADTEKGIDFEGVLEIDFQTNPEENTEAQENKFQIGDTGLVFEIDTLKLDLSDQKNIPEADLDGRGTEFKGCYIERASVILPKKWFKQQGDTTLGIFGRELLIGTGGLSGRIGLEAMDTSTVPEEGEETKEANFTLGNADGFQVGFHEFDLVWNKGNLVSSSLKGSLTIPNFQNCNAAGDAVDGVPPEQDGLRIGIEMFLSRDGDFSISAQPTPKLHFCLENVFVFSVHDLEIGRDDNRFYLCLSGGISFANNDLLKEVISESIEIQNFCIYSDGSFEISGGSIPLPDTIRLPMGPVTLSVNAIHLGTHEKQHEGELREYKYFGFDAGIDINPGGVEANGKGLKYYFTVDDGDFDHYVQIESLQIDLQFPGDVKPEEAALIASGFLSIDGPEYTGAISFQLPKVMLAGGAGMKYNKLYPAFLIDAFLELPVSIPIANTGLGIYGFRGLFGLRYIAARDAVDPVAANWTEYYNAGPEKGIHVDKFKAPTELGAGGLLSALSIGAGVSIATAGDDGKSFSSQLFLLISLLDTILLEGKANVMGERVGITSGDPPFGLVLSFNRGESILLDVLVDYKLPAEESLPPEQVQLAGSILTLNGEINAGFFFNDPGAWYINIGTKEKKITSYAYRVFLVQAYLMISKQGVELGATRGYQVNEKLGPVKIYGELTFGMWGKISFTNETIGGGIEAVGGIEVRFMGVGFGFSISPYLSAIAPKPFLIKGGVELCVEVNLLLKTVKECVTFELTFPNNPDRSPNESKAIYGLPSHPIIMPDPVEAGEEGNEPIEPPTDLPVRAVHMVSGQEYALNYNGNQELEPESIDAVIPMDCWVDIEFKKPVAPTATISGKVRCMTNAPGECIEHIPPSGDWKETHRYSIENIEIEYYDIDTDTWLSYHPYQAVSLNYIAGAVNADEEEQDINVEVGKWQIKDRQPHKMIRLLADSPFSYTNHGQAAWYAPGKAGITGSSLFCEASRPNPICIKWNKFKKFEESRLYTREKLSFRLLRGGGAVGKLASCKDQRASDKEGLIFNNGGQVVLFFHEPIRELRLRLGTTHDDGFTIRYYGQTFNERGDKHYVLIETEKIERVCSITHAKVFEDGPPCAKVEISSSNCKIDALRPLQQNIKRLEETILKTKDKEELINLISRRDELEEHIYSTKLACCKPIGGKVITKQHLKECEYELIKAEKLAQTINDRLNECNREKPDEKCRILLNELKDTLAAADKSRKIYDECLDKRAALECKSVLYEVCFLTEDDYYYSQIRPDQETLQEGYGFLSPAEEGKISQVIWKPDTIYRCKINLKDTLTSYSGGASSPHDETFYFGFKTLGPIGHFPRTQISKKYHEPRPVDSPSLKDIRRNMNEEGIAVIDDTRYTLTPTPENSLKYYIDFSKSYPNADGDLLYAKPLYYQRPYTNQASFNAEGEAEVRNAPSILLFFKDIVNYADLFFSDWGNNPNSSGSNLIVDILDPTAREEGSTATASWERIPVSSYFANQDNVNAPLRLQTTIADNILSSLAGEETCLPEGTVVDPELQYLRIKMTNLQAKKLYNVVIKNRYKGRDSTVHNFNFKTSAYSSFEEHMSSYLLGESADERMEKAVFDLVINDMTNDDYRICWDIVSGNVLNKELGQVYPDDFDKLVYGVLKQANLPPPECNEFNFVRRGDNQDIMGIWIKSKEPFNDPKIKKAVLDEFEAIEVILAGQKREIKYVMSKDYTQIYVMGDWFGTFTAKRRRRLKFIFRYLEPTKDYYEVVSTYEMDRAIVIKNNFVE